MEKGKSMRSQRSPGSDYNSLHETCAAGTRRPRTTSSLGQEACWKSAETHKERMTSMWGSENKQGRVQGGC